MGNQCFKKTLLLQLQLLLSIVSASILLSLESANALNNFWIQGKTVNDWFDKAHANQNINVSASLGHVEMLATAFNLTMDEDFYTNPKLLQKRDWSTQNWVGFGLGVVGGTGLTIAAIAKYCGFGAIFTASGWPCAVGAFSTLLLLIGGTLFSGNWPTEGGEIGSSLNANNKRALADNWSYGNMGGLIDHFNYHGFGVEVLSSETDFKLSQGQPYADGFWVRLHSHTIGPVFDHWVHSSTPYVGTAGYSGFKISNSSKVNTIMKRDYQWEYNDEYWDDAGMITSYCRYNRGSSDLSTPQDMNILVPALNDLTGFLYYHSSPFHWVINDNNHGSRHIAEGIITFSNTFDGTRPGGPPTGGIPTTCYGDHDDVGA